MKWLKRLQAGLAIVAQVLLYRQVTIELDEKMREIPDGAPFPLDPAEVVLVKKIMKPAAKLARKL